MKTTLLIFFTAVILAGCSSTGTYCNYGNRDCTSVIAKDPADEDKSSRM